MVRGRERHIRQIQSAAGSTVQRSKLGMKDVRDKTENSEVTMGITRTPESSSETGTLSDPVDH
jgi:hypothetical protein